MKIYYHLSSYYSHKESGYDFIRCLRALGHQVYTEAIAIATADRILLHDDVLNYPLFFTAHPEAKSKPVIAYSVWETEQLPTIFQTNLEYIDAIWTCSSFCQGAFQRAGYAAHVVPHIVEKVALSNSVLATMKERLQLLSAVPGNRRAEHPFTFFSVIDSINPRKNIYVLLDAFNKLRGLATRPVKLVLRQYRQAIDLATLPDILSFDEDLSREELHALHVVTDAYVSAHHSEGWGLSLSTAMSYGKPVVATGYSGNMEYMDETNSLPVPYTLVPVAEEMTKKIPFFTPDMLWADVTSDALAKRMLEAASGRYPGSLRQNAIATMKNYSSSNVGKIIEPLLHSFSE